ncbi:hypothetical protein [Alteriqipengyuania sp.]|uniref:hypothetical protein n=1 Tax=Alteriqipengyuania sp. TaxID=2800692 RepID=UPI0035181FBC
MLSLIDRVAQNSRTANLPEHTALYREIPRRLEAPLHHSEILPRKMLSVVLVEDAQSSNRALTCFAAFEVLLRGLQPQFREFHLSAMGMGGSETLDERLAQLSANRHVLLAQPALHGNFWDWGEMLSIGDLFMSSIKAHYELQPSGMSLLSLPGAQLDEIARRMKLRHLGQSSSLEAARIALDRAQLFWLGYVHHRTKRRICDSLFAAYQAWSAIKRARPLPF